jgi:hypothetical protein
MDPSTLSRQDALTSSVVRIFKRFVLGASSLDYRIRHHRSPSLTDHQRQMRELVLTFGLWETNTSYQFPWYIDHRPYFDVYCQPFLEISIDWRLSLLLVTAHKQRCDVVRVWKFPIA